MRTNLINNIDKVNTVSKAKVDASSDGKHDMVIAFDTTGSMYSYINAVKKHVKELIPELLKTNPNMKIGIVAFGDYCDMESATVFGNAYQVLPLTDNRDKIINFIKNAKNTNGGDGDEFYELVIKKITEETSWRKDSVKSVLLIADCGPHPVGYNYGEFVTNSQIDWRTEAKKSAALGIKWDTLSINSRYSDWYKELSLLTNGVHAPFKTDTKTNDLIRAAAYSRGGTITKNYFINCVTAVVNDKELTATYAAYSKELLNINNKK